MKPAPFRYFAPRSVEEAVALLADHGGDGKVLAGGQSLVPTMNFRLARPASLIDINRVATLDRLAVADGMLRIGALARHAAFEKPVAPGPLGTFLPEVARHIAHLPIRMRGTFAGSLAHADPASEWCLVAVTLGAEIVVTGHAGMRMVEADAFFRTALTTALEPEELITEVRLPLLGPEWSGGFAEFSRRAGDYALAMAAAMIRIEDGLIREIRLGVGGAAGRPARIATAEQALIGRKPGADAFAAAAEAAAAAIDPLEDVQATAAFRRDLVRAMTRRALMAACGG